MNLQWTKSPVTRLVIGIIFFVVFFLLNTWMENHEQFELSHSSCYTAGGETAPPFYDSIYAAFLNRMGNETSSRVSVIAIKAELEDIQQNLCLQRSYMADLLASLATQNPSVIVIDKYFSPNVCVQNPDSTRKLREVVRLLRMPVIVGESTDTISEEISDSCLVQRPKLDFDAPNVQQGLLSLNANTEQIPLRWHVLPQPPSTPGVHSILKDSLSLKTVAVVAPQRVATEGFQALLAEGARQPYARISPQLQQTTSTNLLCAAGTEEMRKRWSLHCSPTEQKIDLLGKVVLIGAENRTDQWMVLGQQMWGFQLQANYIDALLSDHYVLAFPGSWTSSWFFVFLLIFEAVPIIVERQYRKQKELPYFWKHPFFWDSTAFIVFSGLIVLYSVLKHFLPPLVMLFAMLITYLVHLLTAGLEFSKEWIVQKEK